MGWVKNLEIGSRKRKNSSWLQKVNPRKKRSTRFDHAPAPETDGGAGRRVAGGSQGGHPHQQLWWKKDRGLRVKIKESLSNETIRHKREQQRRGGKRIGNQLGESRAVRAQSPS